MITTHVLDAALGRPARDVAVRLLDADGAELRAARTDADGRAGLGGVPAAAAYRIAFATGDYFAARGQDTFYPEVTVTFTVADPAEHHHVPLLLSPFAYSTYRGS